LYPKRLCRPTLQFSAENNAYLCIRIAETGDGNGIGSFNFLVLLKQSSFLIIFVRTWLFFQLH